MKIPGRSEEKNGEQNNRMLCKRENKAKVAGTSVRMKRVHIGNNKDRQMKKSMISTLALLTGNSFTESFFLVFFSSSSFLKVLMQFVPTARARI
jgi:hypothetical protein